MIRDLFLLLTLLLFCMACRPQVRLDRRFNFYFQTMEAENNEKIDLPTYTEVTINGITRRTSIGKQSELKKLKMQIPPGTHLVEMKKFIWDEKSGSFRPLKKEFQPAKRFVEIKRRKNVQMKMRYASHSRRYRLQVGP